MVDEKKSSWELKSMTVPVLPSLYPSLIFDFHLLPPKSTRWRFPSYLILTPHLYLFLNFTSKLNSNTVPVLPSLEPSLRFLFYLPRCILPDFPSVSSPASLSFISCRHQTPTCTETLVAISTDLFEKKTIFIFSQWTRIPKTAKYFNISSKPGSLKYWRSIMASIFHNAIQ